MMLQNILGLVIVILYIGPPSIDMMPLHYAPKCSGPRYCDPVYSPEH
jgi:hypothetical protein